MEEPENEEAKEGDTLALLAGLDDGLPYSLRLVNGTLESAPWRCFPSRLNSVTEQRSSVTAQTGDLSGIFDEI